MLKEDVINADETGVQVMPEWKTTLAIRGAKDVSGAVKKSLAQITKVSAISATGVMLPYQLIFTGKTDQVLPVGVLNEPAGIHYTHSANHFATEQTTLQFVEKIIIPFISQNRSSRIARGISTEEEESKRWAVLVWDNFSPHIAGRVTLLLCKHRILSFPLPANCTSKYQPLDVRINGVEKRALTDYFSEWYFRAVSACLKNKSPTIDVLPKSASTKRTFIANIIANVHTQLAGREMLIRGAWQSSTVLDGVFDDMEVDTHPPESATVAIDLGLVNQLLHLTLEGRQYVTNKDFEIEETSDPLPGDAPDAHEHDHLMAVDGTTYEIGQPGEFEAEEQQQCNDSDSDSDFEPTYLEAPSSPTSANSGHSSSSFNSVLTSARVHFHRPTTGKSLEVSFEPNHIRLSPQEVCSLISKRVPHFSGIKYKNHSQLGAEEGHIAYYLTLEGVSHGSVAMQAPSLTFLPQDFPNAFSVTR